MNWRDKIVRNVKSQDLVPCLPISLFTNMTNEIDQTDEIDETDQMNEINEIDEIEIAILQA